MKLRLLVMILGAFFMASQASAGLLIDPYVGLGSSAYKVEFDGVSATTDETSNSTVFGSRLGYSFVLVSAGIDYQMMNFKDDDDDDVKITNMSAFVGVDLPILLRFWGEYFLSSDIDVDGTDLTFKDGYAIGVGFTGLPLVSLNLELENLNYDIEVGAFEGTYSLASTIFSVSFPIDL